MAVHGHYLAKRTLQQRFQDGGGALTLHTCQFSTRVSRDRIVKLHLLLGALSIYGALAAAARQQTEEA